VTQTPAASQKFHFSDTDKAAPHVLTFNWSVSTYKSNSGTGLKCTFLKKTFVLPTLVSLLSLLIVHFRAWKGICGPKPINSRPLS